MSTLGSVIIEGLAASRPAAAIPGRLYFATDTKVLSYDNGTSWDTWAPGAAATSLQFGATNQTLSATAPTTGQFLQYDGTNIVGAPGGGSGAWTLISSQTLGAATASVTFSSIPGTFNHLMVVFQARTSDASGTTQDMGMRFNSDTAANYERQFFTRLASGTSVAQAQIAIAGIVTSVATASVATSGNIMIYNYANTSFFKNCNCTNTLFATVGTATTYNVGTNAGLWRSTAAITSITFFDTAGGNFVTGSQFFLYGIT